jgi:hypothetical protein
MEERIEKNGGGLRCGLGRIEGSNRKFNFWNFGSWSGGFNGNLNESVWTFSKVEIWKFGQGFRSNKFELKVWNISKQNFDIWFKGLNQGI